MKITLIVLLFCAVNQIITQNSNTNINMDTCPFAHFRTRSGVCVQCLTKCSRCQNLEGNCEGCAQGSKLSYDQSQCEACQLGKLRCVSDGIISCQRYYTPLNGRCQPICRSQNCKNCQSIIATTCSVCNEGFRLSSDKKCVVGPMLRVNQSPRQLQQSTSTNGDQQRLNDIFSSTGQPNQPTTAPTFEPILTAQEILRKYNLDPNKFLTNPTPSNAGASTSSSSSTTSSTSSSTTSSTSSLPNISGGSSQNVNGLSTSTGAININPIALNANTNSGVTNTAISGNSNGGTATGLNLNSNTSGSSSVVTMNTSTITGTISSNGGSSVSQNSNGGSSVSANSNGDITVGGNSGSSGNSGIVKGSASLPSVPGVKSTDATTLSPDFTTQFISPAMSNTIATTPVIISNDISNQPQNVVIPQSFVIPQNVIIPTSSITSTTTTTSTSTISSSGSGSGSGSGSSSLNGNVMTDPMSSISSNNVIPAQPIQPQFIQPQFIPIQPTSDTSTTTSPVVPTPTPTPTVSVPVSVPIAQSGNCKISQFESTPGFCSNCSQRCLTCINSATQCLQCRQNYIKMGWKCISKDNIGFNVSLKVPKEQRLYATNEGLNQFKKNFLAYILPQQYSGYNSSIISLANAVYDQGNQLLNLTGIVEKIPRIGLADLQSTLSKNLISTSTNLWPNGVLFNGLMFLNSTTGFLGSNNGSSSTDAAPINGTATRSNTPDSPTQDQGPNLVAILVPSIIGGLCLLGLLSTLLCFCLKLCCFKQAKPILIPNSTPQTFRPINHVSQVVNSIPINNAPAVPTPPTVSIIQPAPNNTLIAPVGMQQILRRQVLNANNFVSNTSIGRNIQQQIPIPIPVAITSHQGISPVIHTIQQAQQAIRGSSIKNEFRQNGQTYHTLPQTVTYRTVNQPIPINTNTNANYYSNTYANTNANTNNNTNPNNQNNYNMTTSIVTQVNKNNIPFIYSTVGTGGAQGVTTSSKYQKQQREVLNNNQTIFTKDIKTVQHTIPIIGGQSATNYTYNNNNGGYYDQTGRQQITSGNSTPHVYTLGSNSNSNIGSRIALNQTSPSPKKLDNQSGQTENFVQYSYNRELGIPEQVHYTNNITQAQRTSNLYGGNYEGRTVPKYEQH